MYCRRFWVPGAQKWCTVADSDFQVSKSDVLSPILIYVLDSVYDGPNVLDSVYDVRPENALNNFIKSRKRYEKVERDAADLFTPKQKARDARLQSAS